jgi:hypothetical protein
MDEVILGLSLAAIAVFSFKLIIGWSKYNRSIHKVIYSSYLEYYFKKNKIRKLSESAAFQEDFGKHRVIFQLFSSKDQRSLKAYNIIILSSGMYCLKVSNVHGEIYGKLTGAWENLISFDKKHPEKKLKEKVVNPIIELEQFSRKIKQKISKIETPMYKIVVFPEQSTLKINSKEMGETIIIRRLELRDTLLSVHKSKEKLLNDWEIDALWDMLVKDSLKFEER